MTGGQTNERTDTPPVTMSRSGIDEHDKTESHRKFTFSDKCYLEHA